jgi:spermidine/putrescine transport system ATP-binding protein
MKQGVELDHVVMRFGGATAVRDFTLSIAQGEFFSLLGPSGCGKTTVLRLVAGFLEPTEGVIRIGGEDQRGLPANRRPTAMIFQSLALFPLMPVWENIAFGLEVRGMPRPERRAKAEKLLDLVALSGFGDRRPDQLSGGQRQRVAIARALAVDPQVLLLDEPLSALDLKLRQHMRAELRAIQKRTGVTFLYITHDQGEALAMSDRVGVMSAGALHQVGPPEEIYSRPATAFVASFVGETNRIEGRVTEIANGHAALDTRLGRFAGRSSEGLNLGERATLFVRPERLKLNGAAADAPNTVPVRIVRREFEGAFATGIGVAEDGTEFILHVPTGEAGPAPGETTRLGFSGEDAIVLRADAP